MTVDELRAHLEHLDPNTPVRMVVVDHEGIFIEAMGAEIDSTTMATDAVWLGGRAGHTATPLPDRVEYRCDCGIIHDTSLAATAERCPLADVER